MKKLIFIAIAFLLIGCASPRSNTSSLAKGCDTLVADLIYIHDSLSLNFSGMTHDLKLRQKANNIFAEEKSRAKDCRTEVDAQRSLRKYFAAFQDPHVKANWNGITRYGSLVETSSGKKTNYVRSFNIIATGVYVVNLSGRFFVRKLDSEILNKGSILENDELISCDGRPAQQILDEDILPFEPVSVKEAARYRMAPFIFIRWDQVAGSQTTCLFNRGKQSTSETLTWQTVPENYLAKFETPSVKLYELEKIPRGHWVKLRSFAGYSEDAIAQLEQFAKEAKKLRTDQVIVVDVRGNTGGNSIWGTRWIENLYGYQLKSATEESYVLASPGNFGHFSRLYESLSKQGAIQPKDEARWNKLLQAAKDHPGNLVKVDSPSSTDKAPPSSKKMFKGNIYVLTDFMVFSSGESFVHQLKMMPNVKQVGIATNASTYYSDIRFDMTPSGLVFNFPTMVALDTVNMRASGEPLVPEIKLLLNPDIEVLGKDSLREQVLKMKL